MQRFEALRVTKLLTGFAITARKCCCWCCTWWLCCVTVVKLAIVICYVFEAAEVEGIVNYIASIEVGYDEVRVVIKGLLLLLYPRPYPNAATRTRFNQKWKNSEFRSHNKKMEGSKVCFGPGCMPNESCW